MNTYFIPFQQITIKFLIHYERRNLCQLNVISFYNLCSVKVLQLFELHTIPVLSLIGLFTQVKELLENVKLNYFELFVTLELYLLKLKSYSSFTLN